MKKLLFIESSPRKNDSITTSVCQKLIDNLASKNGEKSDWEVEVLDLWQAQLPEMNGTTMSAKYSIFMGESLSDEQNDSWELLNQYVQQFGEADLVVIAAPMWNWGIPYVLKHYIDVVTQPGLTFNWSPDDGYIPVLPPRDAIIVTSSGGDYTVGSGNEHEDFAFRYLKMWLKDCMGCRVESIDMTMTATGQESVDQAYLMADHKIASLSEMLY